MTKITKVTVGQTIAIHKRLNEVVTKLDGGLCCFIDGHSDTSVATEIGVHQSGVERIRREMFGKIKNSQSDVTKRMEEIEMLVKNLLSCYDGLMDRHNKLITMLALNRVVDCKHLEINKSKVAS